MRVLVFGDSITQGYWDTEGGWVKRIRSHYDLLQITDLNGRDEPTIFVAEEQEEIIGFIYCNL